MAYELLLLVRIPFSFLYSAGPQDWGFKQSQNRVGREESGVFKAQDPASRNGRKVLRLSSENKRRNWPGTQGKASHTVWLTCS